MLDLGLTKMALIGVVALVVLGPERLPGVARTAGALFGRAQRYINDVKAEVSREMELDELKKMRTEFETAASNVENKIHDNLRQHENELNDAWNQGTSVSDSVAGGGDPNLTHVSGDTWRSNSGQHVQQQQRVAGETQELARQAGRHSELVQAHHVTQDARSVRCGARGAAYA